MQSLNRKQENYVSDRNFCNLIVKKSVTICNFPIDERNNLVYNAYKKEHRDSMAICKCLSKANVIGRTVTYFEIILGGL